MLDWIRPKRELTMLIPLTASPEEAEEWMSRHGEAAVEFMNELAGGEYGAVHPSRASLRPPRRVLLTPRFPSDQ